MMNLHPEWKSILKRAWSIRLILVAGFFSGLEFALPYLQEIFQTTFSVRPGMLSLISFIIANGAFVFRLLAQNNMPKDQ